MSTLENNADEQLAPFLRQLADSIEHNQLSSDQIQQIGEFFMSYKIRNQSEENNSEINNPSEFIKFLTLGMYIYRFVLNSDGEIPEKIPQKITKYQ
jgi:hypothetical protein